ncbi:ATP-binding protein [Hymenobacter metallilatus]|uniref:histidine kinase n=1 Tax=Hymenobacter metallilatus TaxID=2493666 RepID=A0A3R9PEJ8_9BACT|nr:ATP-binding protein [Hymenobacter metallilatus]RSK35441.1 GAF domain-containing protein [Hymenobacter metallilatus]
MDRTGITLTDESLVGQEITLTNCDREPIHIPGLIQPYGFLLCLDEHSHRVVQASANTWELLGMAAEELIGQGLDWLFEPARLMEINAQLEQLREGHRLLGVRLDQLPGRPFYKLILHRFDALLWLEFEPVAASPGELLDMPSLNDALGQMLAAVSVVEFCEHAVQQVRAITGFDRVMAYRFAEDESGEVVAEARRPDLESFLGLHYPATDIPKQARAMYLKNWLRFIPDVGYLPVPLVPVRNPSSQRPPDMTYSVLRSVSPIHVEYLQNMGVGATMTISLIREGKLWGLLVCHHYSPRLVSYELRDLCQFIGKTFSALLRSKEQADDFAYQVRLREHQARLFGLLAEFPDFRTTLYQHLPVVKEIFDCGGVVVSFEGDIGLCGNTPTEAQARELLAWLDAHMPGELFHTSSYTRHNPAGVVLRATASGILAIRLSHSPGDYLIWLRPEVLQTVTWAGKQQKAEIQKDGVLHLSPRSSFAAWSQSVENTALEWKPLEIDSAQEIRLRIADIRLRLFNEIQERAQVLTRLNAELERSNDELDSFAYVASHDLKEPLRGIHNYSVFLLEDYADKLDAEGIHKLETLVRLSQRMEALIESLLQLSRVGRLEPEVQQIDVNQVVREVVEILRPRLEQNGVQLSVAQPLPIVQADPVRLREVFNNLLTNAMRYNDSAVKTVEVGVVTDKVIGPRGPIDPAAYHTFYVRDNGIGINSRHHESIFKIFKRLHGQDKYGGGTGAGLAIAKKMIEKSGGQLWVESQPQEGATFFFSVPK